MKRIRQDGRPPYHRHRFPLSSAPRERYPTQTLSANIITRKCKIFERYNFLVRFRRFLRLLKLLMRANGAARDVEKLIKGYDALLPAAVPSLVTLMELGIA